MVRLAIFNAVFPAFVIPLGLDTPMIIFERLPCWVNVKQMVLPTILTAGVTSQKQFLLKSVKVDQSIKSGREVPKRLRK